MQMQKPPKGIPFAGFWRSGGGQEMASAPTV